MTGKTVTARLWVTISTLALSMAGCIDPTDEQDIAGSTDEQEIIADKARASATTSTVSGQLLFSHNFDTPPSPAYTWSTASGVWQDVIVNGSLARQLVGPGSGAQFLTGAPDF